MLDDINLREAVIALLRSLKRNTLTDNVKMLYVNFYGDGLQQTVTIKNKWF